jgi:aminomethyltransferase
MGYVPYEGNLNTKGFPIGNFGKKYKVHLPKKYSNKPVDAAVVPIPFTQSFNVNTRESEILAILNK